MGLMTSSKYNYLPKDPLPKDPNTIPLGVILTCEYKHVLHNTSVTLFADKIFSAKSRLHGKIIPRLLRKLSKMVKYIIRKYKQIVHS